VALAYGGTVFMQKIISRIGNLDMSPCDLVFVTKYRKKVFLEKSYWKGGLWSPSYFTASCGGAPISIIRQYIEQQTPDE
jgi:REP element-mobilizing transposase RayT